MLTVILVTWLLVSFMLWPAKGYDAAKLLNTLYNDTLGSEKEFTITVGMHVNMDNWKFAFANAGVFILGVNRINNQYTLLPNHRIKLILKDDKANTEVAFLKALEFSGIRWADSAQEPIEQVDFIFGSS